MKRSSLSNPHSSNSRRASLIAQSSALAAVAILAACEDPQPPFACGTLGDHTMYVHQDRLVLPCFRDPEMEEMALSAESSDTAIVTAVVLAYGVAISAISPGSATVTVIATDPDLLSASASFTVEVPNRPPWRRGRMPDVHLFSGGSSFRLISQYFTDPDNQELSYSARSSDTAVVSLSQFGGSMTLEAHDEGSTTLTVTATDAFGESVSQEAMATVRMPVRMLRNDFAEDGSLSGWELSNNSDAIVAEGKLRFFNVVAGLLGWVEAEVAAAPWEASASMGNATDSVFVALVAGTDHSRYRAYLIQIGLDYDVFTDLGRTNYRFFVFDADHRTWTYANGWYGLSPQIGGVGDLTEVTLAAQGGNLTVHVGSTELIRVDLESRGLSDQLTYLAFASWPKCCETGHAAIVDWVELRGIPVDGSSMEELRANADLAERLSEINLGKGILYRDFRVITPGQRVPSGSGRRE